MYPVCTLHPAPRPITEPGEVHDVFGSVNSQFALFIAQHITHREPQPSFFFLFWRFGVFWRFKLRERPEV